MIVTIIVSTLALTLGMGLMLLGETEALQSKAFQERQRARVAVRDVVELTAAWFTAPTDRVPRLPPPEEWITDWRRGDTDGDGRADAACDGSQASGEWTLWPAVNPDEPTAGRLADAVNAVCGTASHPDLALTMGHSPFLAELAATLGENVLIERVSVHAAPALRMEGSHAMALEVSATVVLRRGSLLVARTTATARVRALPSLASGDVIVAGGDVSLARGGEVRWGRVACDGDLDLPPLDAPGFPYSGLPRQADGSPVSFAPGGPVDWNLTTPARECLLTELMGRTKRGSWRIVPDMVAPTLADPWLSFAAGGIIRVGAEALAAPIERQPRPYDARWTDLERDLSHLSAAWALRQRADGRGRASEVEELAISIAQSGSGMQRFVLDADTRSGAEPLWREGGIGPARSAAEWIERSDRPLMAAFVTGGAPPPEVVTLTSGRGLVLFEARQVKMTAPQTAADAALQVITMPGEPFVDTGIDADGDGEIDPGTAGNGRWDADIDDDGVADQGPPQDWLFEAQVLPWFEVPSRDADPAMLESMPHEAFLSLDYPAEDAATPTLRVRQGVDLGGTGRPVRDLDGDGLIRAGVDRLTTVARDAEGARQMRPAAFAGVVACLGGDIVMSSGSSLHGALRATGNVLIEEGASVTFDAGLERDGVPSDQPLPSGCLGALAWTRGVIVDPLRPVGEAESDPGEGRPPGVKPRGPASGRGDPPAKRPEGSPSAPLGASSTPPSDAPPSAPPGTPGSPRRQPHDRSTRDSR